MAWGRGLRLGMRVVPGDEGGGWGLGWILVKRAEPGDEGGG